MRDGYHMTPEELRRSGQAALEWLIAYGERVEELPVLSPLQPGDVLARLPEHPPEHGEPFDDLLADLDAVVLPGLTHWQSPRFFGYFPANTSGPSVLGELLAAGLGVQGMLWQTSPAATELEQRVLDWLAELLDLPRTFRADGPGGGVIQDSASSATLCALLAARARATDGAVEEQGLAAAAPLTVYASEAAHSSVDKAVRIAGLGAGALRRLPVDAGGRLRPDALREALDTDVRAGHVPALVVATVGTTSSLAIDPVAAIAEHATAHGAWLHVDAAMAGCAAICPEHRDIHRGLEAADSYCVNPHKWLFVNLDCDAFYVADRRWLHAALGVDPEYLRNPATASGQVTDYRDWQIPLGRRFRALKLWFVLRHYGAEGLRFHLRRHIALAEELAEHIDRDPHLERAGPVALNLVCFRHTRGEAATAALRDRLNASGTAFLTHTVYEGRLALRACVGQTHTERRHVTDLAARLQEIAAELAAELD